jgi:hypothetical protein
MRLRGLLGVLSGVALAACVVVTDGDTDPVTGNNAGSSGRSGAAGSAGASGSGAAGSAGASGTGGSAGSNADAGRDVGSGGSGDAAIDVGNDSGAGGSAADAGGAGGETDGGGTGGATDGADPTLSVHCSAIVSACPLVAFAQCELYLAGLTASARARVVSCMSTGCNLAACARDL